MSALRDPAAGPRKNETAGKSLRDSPSNRVVVEHIVELAPRCAGTLAALISSLVRHFKEGYRKGRATSAPVMQ